MSWWVQWHWRLLSKQYASKKDQHSPPLLHWNDVKHLRVLFLYENPEDWTVVSSACSTWQQEGKQIEILGFVPGAKKEDQFGFPFFSKKDLTFFGLPKEEVFSQLQNPQPDISILCSTQFSLPLFYMMAHLKASSKVGAYFPSAEFIFDFMLQTNQNSSLSAFIQQTQHYLKHFHSHVPLA